ncbi:MAG: polysaccharide biosynthesis tyrosine autokinase, partial [Clostridia bacterium]
RKKISIIVIITISIIIGSVYTFKYTTPRYKSSASVILGKVSSASNGEVLESEKDITMSDLNLNSSLIDTYSELVRSRSIMESVSQRLNHTISVDSLMESVSVARVGSSDLLQVTATNNDPVIAKNIVTEVVDVFSEYVKEIYKIENVYIIDQPSIEYVPYNINHVRDIAISILMGLIISILYVYIYSFVDNTVKSSKDIEELLNVKTLINIPFDKNKKEELITVNDSKSIISEAFKTLRTNIQFSNVDLKGAQTLLITSCLPSEGKSYVSANLAITFAQAGKKVILVDSDMRRGRQSKIFKVSNMNGLSNYISNIDSNGMEINWNLGEYIKRTDIKNLNIITAGSVPPNPAELLASARLNELIESLKNYYDIIIFDGAPILPITDSLILGRVLEKVMLVAENNKTKKDNLVKAKSNIEDVGGKVIGIALNKVDVSNGKYGDEYYYYYSSQDEKTNTFKEKICAFTKEKIEKTHNCFENLVKKIKSLNKRISDVNKSEKMNKIEQRKIEAEKKKEVQRRIKAVEIEENKRKIQERKRQAEEKAKRDAEIAKMREAEKQ